MSGRNDKNEMLVVGGEPRVSLLPPELEARKRAAATRRLAAIVVFISVAVAAVASGAAWYYQVERNGRLVAAKAETAALIQQQNKYADVKAAAAVVEAAEAARLQVAASEVDWAEYLGKATVTLPAGSLVHTIQVDTETLLAPIAPPTGVLMPARMGMITWDVSFPTVQAMHEWVTSLEDVPGYVDARSVRVYWTTVDYRANIIFTFDQNALAHRFDGESGTDDGAGDDPAEPADTETEPDPSATPDPSGSATPDPSGTPSPNPSSGTTGVKR